jgi:OmpA-OmpF porin, OOP family
VGVNLTILKACVLVLISSFLAQADEFEVFIPGVTKVEPHETVEPSMLARCINSAKLEYCAGIQISGDGSIYESYAEQEIVLETLIFDEGNNIITPTKVTTTLDDETTSVPSAQILDSTVSNTQEVIKSIGIEIMFDYDSKKIRKDQSPKLIKLASALSEEINVGSAFALVGHTDSKGTEAYNCRLSLGRASSVVTSLAMAGTKSSLYAVGAGEYILRDATDPESERNRRVSIVKLDRNLEQILGAISNLCN